MSSFIRAAISVLALALILVSPMASGVESSNLFLPSHVDAPDGQVSLYADFGGVESDGRVPVYLVNKTTEVLVLDAQDGDIYLKLQYQDADGNWVRAQPHGYSWCGVSYFEMELSPGHYLLLNGYQPINGASQTVRYRAYSQSIEIVSNTGMGVVADADIRRASNDVLSIRESDIERLTEIALSPVPVENTMDHMRDLRTVAIRELASDRFDPAKSREILVRIRDSGSDVADNAAQAIEMMERRAQLK
ncbi:MAG: hypothetical protein QNI99_20190 [Woeseiaceae bacterium]|nr:hypothetical protein [Woeseiaceae bacterium]